MKTKRSHTDMPKIVRGKTEFDVINIKTRSWK